MSDRKDLIFAGMGGAVLSIVGCLLLTPRDTAQRRLNIPEQAVASKPGGEARPASPQPSTAVVTHHLRLAETPVTTVAKTPVVLPESMPSRKSKASPSLSASTEAKPIQPVLIAQSHDASGSEQAITAENARIALREVGTNPEAEAVWIAAINDPTIPAPQRKDLIEDLNEEGFADPKHLTADDLPRIEGRLTLIEDLAPQALDQTNADAFQEAYKDLKDMHARLDTP